MGSTIHCTFRVPGEGIEPSWVEPPGIMHSLSRQRQHTSSYLLGSYFGPAQY